jgi:hypothetical protein
MANAYSSQRGTVRKAKKGGGYVYRTPKKSEAEKRAGSEARAQKSLSKKLSKVGGARPATSAEIKAAFG